jgi:SAM-dependent methyltransferase
MYDKKRMIDIYNRNAPDREKNTIAGFKINEIDNFMNLLRSEKKQNILDVGCGTGEIASIFQIKGFKILGMDFSEKMLEYVKQKNIDTMLLDCYDIDKIARKFDAVFSMNCLLHIPTKDIGIVLSHIKSVLNINGLFYLGLWAGDDFEGIYEKDELENKRYFVFYRQKTLIDRLSDYFRIEYYRCIEAHEKMHFHSCVMRKID